MKPLFKKGSAVLFGFCVLGLLFALPAAQARSFRAPTAIVKPGELPEGAELIIPPRAFPPYFVEQKVRELLGAWNTPGFGSYLSDDFYGKDRLLDRITEAVPRDARVQVLSVQGDRIVRQYRQKSPDGSSKIVSDVEVRVFSEVVLNDATLGFVRLPGMYTLNLTITSPDKPKLFTPLPASMR